MVVHPQPIPFVTLPNWVKAAAKCGFNIETVFRELGTETDLVHLETATITVPMLERVMEACIARTRQGYFPFALGETFAFDYLPDLETFLNTSSSLREATRVFEWVRELINPMLDIQLEEQGNEAHLVLVTQGAPEDPAAIKPYFCETTFASILKFGRNLLGEDAAFGELRFRHVAPPHVAEYERHFRLPLRFEQPRDELVFDRALLDQPLEGGFPALHRQAEYRAAQLLRQAPKRAGLTANIEEVYARQPQLISQGIGAVAAALKLHPRTLQRRLREEGATFAEVHDRARYHAAISGLQAGITNLEELSERLGFSDRRSFTRAFKRWSGVSPSAFRNHSQPTE
jgi:AraC-like DNA-binding protein